MTPTIAQMTLLYILQFLPCRAPLLPTLSVVADRSMKVLLMCRNERTRPASRRASGFLPQRHCAKGAPHCAQRLVVDCRDECAHRDRLVARRRRHGRRVPAVRHLRRDRGARYLLVRGG